MNSIFSLELFAIYLSNYSAHMVEYGGVVYPTAEHAYQCQRYTNEVLRKEIRETRSPVKAWEVSQKYKKEQLIDFNERKVLVMKEILRAKLEQHADIQKILVDSGTYKIVKHITTGPPADGFWDDGDDGLGQNEIGKIWMELRTELAHRYYK
jgi:ribA/ribD-fused uncharacterized protein